MYCPATLQSTTQSTVKIHQVPFLHTWEMTEGETTYLKLHKGHEGIITGVVTPGRQVSALWRQAGNCSPAAPVTTTTQSIPVLRTQNRCALVSVCVCVTLAPLPGIAHLTFVHYIMSLINCTHFLHNSKHCTAASYEKHFNWADWRAIDFLKLCQKTPYCS